MQHCLMAQRALADLKVAAAMLLSEVADPGLSNAEIGRALAYALATRAAKGTSTFLALMETEGLVVQDPDSKRWRLRVRLDPSRQPGAPLEIQR